MKTNCCTKCRGSDYRANFALNLCQDISCECHIPKEEKVMQEPSWELSDTQPELEHHMKKTTKAVIITINAIIKDIKRDFGPRCKEENIDCGICKAYRLISYLEWYMELIDG